MTEPTVFELPVHPWADRFPMRSPEDLESMAQSIKANGLRMPIVLGMATPVAGKKAVLCVIDGRNRREACRIAGIEDPPTITLDGEDQDAYIADANLERRDLSKGQKAMLMAVRFPRRKRGPKGEKETTETVETRGVSAQRISAARLVNELCPEMVEAIISGKQGLDDALVEAQRRRTAATTEESRFARLELTAPDLAVHVQEERMKLAEAEAALREREADLRRQAENAQKIVADINKAVALLEGVYVRRIADFALSQPELFDGLTERVAAWINRLHGLHAALVDPQQQQQYEEREEVTA